jgi:ABC-2 type transport system ATP-binding protein
MSTPIIEVESLERRFGAFVAVKGVSFHVERGEIFGYLGANGAGKSTTIRMLCGLLLPTHGRATVAGVDVVKRPQDVKQSLGYMSQKFSLYTDLTVEENVDFFGGAYGLSPREVRRRSAELLALVELDDHRRSVTGKLPGGFRQRAALACALLHEPPLLFLDEPTAGVDPVARRRFWDLIRTLAARGTTIFVTTHYMDEAEYCARVGFMVDGELKALDTPSALKRTHAPGRHFEVEVAGDLTTSALRARLTDLPGARRIEPFGAGFHVAVSEDAATLAHEQLARDPSLRFRQIEPTLEDVFLVLAEPGAPVRATA